MGHDGMVSSTSVNVTYGVFCRLDSIADLPGRPRLLCIGLDSLGVQATTESV